MPLLQKLREAGPFRALATVSSTRPASPGAERAEDGAERARRGGSAHRCLSNQRFSSGEPVGEFRVALLKQGGLH